MRHLRVDYEVTCSRILEVSGDVNNERNAAFILPDGAVGATTDFWLSFVSGKPSLWKVKMPSELISKECLETSFFWLY
jgi:hypothetical protein